jgi:arginyl-tRNA--protein-N-Asp/Glu arginylyltransferase
MNKLYFLSLLTFFQITNLFPSNFKIFTLKNLEKKINEAGKTKLTKENIKNFIKRSDDFDYKNKKDILKFVSTPQESLEKEINEELKNFNWTLDENFINKLNELKNRNDKISLINEKIFKLHNQRETPILILADDLIYEITKEKILTEKIQTFIEEQQTKQGFINHLKNKKKNSEVFFAKLNNALQTLAKSKNNALIISNFLNGLFKV